jgi:hypothetical protein
MPLGKGFNVLITFLTIFSTENLGDFMQPTNVIFLFPNKFVELGLARASYFGLTLFWVEKFSR